MKRLWLLLPLLLAACAPKKAEAPAPEAPSPLRVEVRAVAAMRGVLERESKASATLQAERDSLVAAGASGRVVRTLPAGSQVQAGEGVVFLDPAPFQEALEAARLNLKQAEANLERARNQLAGNRKALAAQLQAAETQLQAARRRYEEGKALLEAGALAPLDLKALEANLHQAESAYENAREALARLERAEDIRLLELQVEAARLQVRQAERNLKESVVRAPFAGEVVEVFVKEGEFLGVGSRAFRLATTDRLLARLYLPPEKAQALTPETPFTLRQNGKETPAALLRKTDLPGQTRLVEVVLKPQDPLLPGPAEVRYRERVAEGILLPAGAVRAEGGQGVVYLLEGGRARRQPVRLVAQEGNRAVVEGLPEGAKVIYPVPEGLRDGDTVEVVP
ncbi:MULTISPECIES: efflux RND transporter periplasmic adaptor subunit [Thermus]|jgi:HlyD family secretion protein|uniref:Putative efflux pump membrane fusion protein n=1 Tax=Thermus brockianus TaxID=56956 RepID=A0A1J0LR43_THEBO|nr:HlyD family efflux transporter periplasmic adaptor subunit [Thermus brockianus]APD08522.1 putative efflux pump membrane fusion protein [Thermus brockianus]BDG16125.1 RND transporter [Thermus brockianus]